MRVNVRRCCNTHFIQPKKLARWIFETVFQKGDDTSFPRPFLPYWNIRRILAEKAIDAIYLCILSGFSETQHKINIFHNDQLNFAEYRLYTRSRIDRCLTE